MSGLPETSGDAHDPARVGRIMPARCGIALRHCYRTQTTVTLTSQPRPGCGNGRTCSRSVGQVKNPARFADAVASARALSIAGEMPSSSGLMAKPAKAWVCVLEAADAADAGSTTLPSAPAAKATPIAVRFHVLIKMFTILDRAVTARHRVRRTCVPASAVRARLCERDGVAMTAASPAGGYSSILCSGGGRIMRVSVAASRRYVGAFDAGNITCSDATGAVCRSTPVADPYRFCRSRPPVGISAAYP